VLLRIYRERPDLHTTLGVLFVDGRYLSFTLEDVPRKIKIPGETAIPAGTYRTRLSFSHRFQRPLPELLDVPGFTGIRIHAGNRRQDTDGCILVGFARSAAVVQQSRPAEQALTALIHAATERGEAVLTTISAVDGSDETATAES
jgi:hypothetical protein